MRQPKLPINCGTPAGYQLHLRHKETTCPPCRDSWVKYRKMSRAEKAWTSTTQRFARYLRGDLG